MGISPGCGNGMMVYEVDSACWGDEWVLLMLARERRSAYRGLEGEVSWTLAKAASVSEIHHSLPAARFG